MDAAAKFGRNPVSKNQIQPEYGDEQADAGQGCRTRLARPNSQARTVTICVTIHKYIHTERRIDSHQSRQLMRAWTEGGTLEFCD